MDISKISEFLSYTPYLDMDVDILAKNIFSRISYLSDTQKDTLYRTYHYAKKHHDGAFRLSGEEYIVHPLRVVEFLIQLQPDLETLQTALMHDLIEDTKVSYEDITENFGEEVARLCEGLVKVSTVRRSGEDRQLETLKKTFLAMGKDLRVIFIKIADRVHNIQTLHFHPTLEKRKRIALETLKIYVPIAKRLGLYVLQGYLENGSFAQLEPEEYSHIAAYVDKHYSGGDNYKNIGVQRLERLCKEEGIEYVSLQGRVKSPYRIWRKLQKHQSTDISKIMDAIAFRIITTKVSDCYTVLGIIHKHYTPIFAKMKDYIAIPKPNGYKSLHTTILGMFDFPVEIQVRTQKMDAVANYGVAAHFAYSDDQSKSNPVVSQEQQEWIERLQDIVTKFRESPNKEDFKHELNIELLHKTIFVYTPKGDIIELPVESTVLDFAFRVHTDVGLKFKNAHVNGKIVPIDYQLKTGDIVTISTFKSKLTANRGRLRYVSTPGSKNKLQKYLRQFEKQYIFKYVEQKINEKLHFYELPGLHSKADRISKSYQGTEYESMLYKVYDGQLRVTRLLREIYTDQMRQKDMMIIDKQEEVIELVNLPQGSVIIDGHQISNSTPCPECTPEYGDSIIARSGNDGIKYHTIRCEALQKINAKKLLEAHRNGKPTQRYTVEFIVLSIQKPGALLQLLRIIERFDCNIESLYTQKIDANHQSIRFMTAFKNPSTIGFINESILEKSLFKKVEVIFDTETQTK